MYDIRTVLTVWAIECGTLAALLLTAWLSMDRPRSILYWAAGFGCHGAGIAGVALRGSIPDFLSIEVANAVQLLGTSFWYMGLLAYDRRRIPPVAFLPVFIWIGAIWIPEIRQEMWARMALYHVASTSGFAMMAVAMVSRSKSFRHPRNLFAALQSFLTINSAVAFVVDVFTRPQSFAEVAYGPAFILFLPLGILGSLLVGTRLVLLEKEERLHMLAVTDPLTGALNRRGLEAAFTRFSSHTDTARPLLAVLQFDLDNFKRINDEHGHHAGDKVLLTFAQAANAVVAGLGEFVRLGGEEFACLMRAATAAEAVAVAGRIRAALNHTPVPIGATSIQVSASAGISMALQGNAVLSRLLVDADQALYAAKRAGRDRIGLMCEGGAEIVSPDDEAIMSESTDRQVAALNRMGAIGRF